MQSVNVLENKDSWSVSQRGCPSDLPSASENCGEGGAQPGAGWGSVQNS